MLVESPTRSGQSMSLGETGRNLAHSLHGLFLPDAAGYRPCNSGKRRYSDTFTGRVYFYLTNSITPIPRAVAGATHPAGWSALIANLMNLEAHWASSKPGFVGH